MTAPKRPRRQFKADRFRSPGSSQDEIRADYAVAPFDRAMRKMDRRWGIDRLPELVTPTLSEKFGAAIAYMSDRIDNADPEGAAAAAANAIKGLQAMDAEALALGHKPVPAEVWIVEVDGQQFGLVHEAGDWPTLQEAYPHLNLFSLREAAIAVQSYRDAGVAAAKDAFPGAQVVAFNPNKPAVDYKNGGDPIPF